MIEKLCALRSPISGEWELGKYLAKELADCADEVGFDGLGNIIARKKGGGEKLMLIASLYEPGIMCVYAEENGLLRFEAREDMAAEGLVFRRVGFESAVGIIGCEGEKPEADKLYIDIGAKSREEAEKTVPIGSIGLFFSEYKRLANNRAAAAGISQRAKCAALLKTAKAGAAPFYDTYFVIARAGRRANPQGAYTAQNIIKPAIAISVDTAEAAFRGERPRAVRLGEGPAVKIKDSSLIAHESVVGLLSGAARELGFKAPFEVSSLYSGAGGINADFGAIPAGALSIPCSYLNSCNEVLCEDDVWRAAEILSAIVYKR